MLIWVSNVLSVGDTDNSNSISRPETQISSEPIQPIIESFSQGFFAFKLQLVGWPRLRPGYGLVWIPNPREYSIHEYDHQRSTSSSDTECWQLFFCVSLDPHRGFSLLKRIW